MDDKGKHGDTQRDSETKAHDSDQLLPIDEHVEEVSENGRRVTHRGVYLLPNLFTTSALFAGFYAVISAINGQFESAAIAIYVAMILDGLDGRIARMTNTQSAFGVEYDSLADMISFGMAPAIVVFSWALSDMGKFGWAAAFVYTTCAALRLARFNTQVKTADKRYFTGLASPPAAAVIAGMVWIGHDMSVSNGLAILALIVTLAVGILMITNIPYHSFKGVDFKGRVPFVKALAVLLFFVVVVTNPPLILLFVAGVYALSGPFLFVLGQLKRR